MQVTASKAGIAAPKVEKRTGDSVLYQIDCQSLLSPKEIAYGYPTYSATDLTISEVQVVSGNLIQFRVSGGPTKVPYTDYSIVFTVNTTMRNVLTVPITIRVYSN